MDETRTAVVTGVTGVVGRNLALHLAASGGWEVIGVSRRTPDIATTPGVFRHIALDLLDAAACRRALGGLAGVTHIFHAAYLERPTMAEAVAPNLALLVNTVDAVEPAAQRLKHVHLLQGTKYYGNHLGVFKTPAKETDPRHMPPNFYYDQEDFIRGRQAGKAWSWSASRPHAVCGFAVGNPMNLAMVIAVYAAVSRELGLPLSFPGTPGNYRALYQCTDAGHLARAIAWMATEPRCANQVFNVTNGDLIRWENLWPRLAAHFGMEPGPPRTIRLTEMMADKTAVWERMVARHRLRPYRYEEIVSWAYGDFVFTPEFDIVSDMTKARQFGFCDAVDTGEMFFGLFDRLREDRVIP